MAGITLTIKNLQDSKVDKLVIYDTVGAGRRFFKFLQRCAGYTIRRESIRAGYIRKGHCVSFRYSGKLGEGFAYCEHNDNTTVKIYYLTRRRSKDELFRVDKKDDHDRHRERQDEASAASAGNLKQSNVDTINRKRAD